eukprot:Phypoly_transcript_08316.p1 GENE.Phypoly_transcript_08316~~Phypoly_transcript_08316.p1  ORF type:complete len:479 (+),score=59.00 Phypoly_transcript_08316:44-1480(+)
MLYLINKTYFFSHALVIVEGPITGGLHGWPFAGDSGDLSAIGYIEEEYFISGSATRYFVEGELTIDGWWNLVPNSTAPFKTRILVRRPKNAEDFNGTVVVEWANVSSGFEILTIPVPLDPLKGFAYVSVSAQYEGLYGFLNQTDPLGLVYWDPKRYGTLSIPDDGVSYDIFTQAAKALRDPASRQGPNPTGNLIVQKIIAIGASQSGSRMLAYTNGVQPLTGAFDALFPLINAGTAADFLPVVNLPRLRKNVMSYVRDDLVVPVFVVNTETEMAAYPLVRQPDTPLFRSWEIAGASHGPTGMMQGLLKIWKRDGIPIPPPANKTTPSASNVLWLPTVQAALWHVQNWIISGVTPPQQPIISTCNNTKIIRDAYGNALGGIRLPETTVPVASYTGQGQGLSGSTHPFSIQTLSQLYPTYEDYEQKVAAAANAALMSGVIVSYRVAEYTSEGHRFVEKTKWLDDSGNSSTTGIVIVTFMV